MGWHYSLDFHRKILNCRPRNLAYSRAITQALRVQPNPRRSGQVMESQSKAGNSAKKKQPTPARSVPNRNRVLDLGSGTGLLSMIAYRQGAKKCTLVESDLSMLRLSQKAIRQNFPGEQHQKAFRFVNKDIVFGSLRGTKADVIVSETFGTWPFEEGLLEVMTKAQTFKASPSSIVIPRKVTQFAAPIHAPDLTKTLTDFSASVQTDLNISLSAAADAYLTNLHAISISPSLIDQKEQIQFAETNLDSTNASFQMYSIDFPPTPKPTFGFAFWWEASLFEDVTLSTSPFAPATHWKQAYLPLKMQIPQNTPAQVRLMTNSAEGWDLHWEIWTRTSMSTEFCKVEDNGVDLELL